MKPEILFGLTPRRSASRRRPPGPPSVSLLLTVAVLAAAAPVGGQEAGEAPSADRDAALTGIVSDAATGEPVVAAVVAFPSLGIGTSTDGQGRYAMDGLPPGELELEVRLPERATVDRTVTLRSGAVNRADLSIRLEAVELPGLEVTVRRPIPRGKMAGFYLRMEEGPGVYVTREEIEETSPGRMTDVFRRVPGVRVIRPYRLRPNVFGLQMARAQPTFTGEGADCRPRYFVDGRPFEVGKDGVNGALDPGDVAGIEVYRGVAEIPARFNGPNARCGVVVVWTRDASTEAWHATEGG